MAKYLRFAVPTALTKITNAVNWDEDVDEGKSSNLRDHAYPNPPV